MRLRHMTLVFIHLSKVKGSRIKLFLSRLYVTLNDGLVTNTIQSWGM